MFPAALSAAVVTLTLGAVAVAAAEQAATVTPKAAFEKIKALAGTWEGTIATPEGPRAVVRYEVTSGGSVVMETIAPGEVHEMRSMYHMEGDGLVFTHYCAAGNQPKLRLTTMSGDEMAFDFAGGTNLDPAKDGHIHAGRIKLVTPDKLEAEWHFFQGGKQSETMKFLLARKK